MTARASTGWTEQQRRLVELQVDHAKLERPGERSDQRKAAGAMNAAKGVARADHLLRRLLLRVELQHREPVRQGREMLVSLVEQDAEQHRGERDSADGDFVGLG